MAREKVKALTTIENWEDADQKVKLVGELGVEITDLEASATEKINKIQKELQESTKTLMEAKAAALHDVEKFCELHKEDFGDKKSKELAFGEVGFRLSTEITIKKGGTPGLITALKAKHLDDCVRIKESLDKDALGKLADENPKKFGALEGYGLSRVTTDQFWCEPKKATAKKV